ncbi:vomeronasal type-1 receptor 4-like [Meriones unguiculatus]|uniref:vomeronasal type-1 receptor 4-like n=1 Tax=Meriones unguiculatus TaxID=10047 RepID=UPI000B4EAF1E|nr:vomeronasal type-1 receptor 4-like [Meriones unguiculatus]
MVPSDTILGIFIISQLCIGVIGNSTIFLLYLYSYFFKLHFMKLIDSLFTHLTIVNMLFITFSLIPDILASFGVPNMLDDIGCKVVLFMARVLRGMSICTTCVVSTCQVITIIPSNSKWAWLKSKLSTWAFFSLLCSWLINLLIYAYIFEAVIAKINSTHVGSGYLHAYCQNKYFGNRNSWIFLSVILIHDLFFVAIMTCASCYKMTFLYRHHKRAQHLHSLSLSSQPSPESKATHHILFLVTCFVFIYWLNNSITLYGFYAETKIPRLEGINAVLTTCYSTICPFLLMRNNKIILQFTSSFSILRMSYFQSALPG